jgi:hypothetical protein
MRGREGHAVVEKVTFAAPKTKQLAELLGTSPRGREGLVLTNGANQRGCRAATCRPSMSCRAEVSAYDVI